MVGIALVYYQKIFRPFSTPLAGPVRSKNEKSKKKLDFGYQFFFGIFSFLDRTGPAGGVETAEKNFW